MSTSPPPGRDYAGRHRVRTRSARLPRSLGPGSVLPTATAAALVVAAAGATLAQAVVLDPPSAEASVAALDLTVEEVVAVREEAAVEEAVVADLAVRRQAATLQSSATRGRAEAKQRAAVAARQRAAQKAAKAKEAARAKAAAEAKEAARKARAERRAKRWVRAIHTGSITSDFGPRWGRTHDGLDIGAPTGTPLYAMSKGTVILSGEVPSFGNKIEIRYWDGTVSWYGHLSRRYVSTGDTVMPGEVVGAVGSTGHSFGPHLHIEIHPTGGDNPVDPYPWLARKGLLG
ncbi:MAG TPA: M23 family metallopeptidase [Ornithinibacter sp.]|nr:M23 family metallopeptidase [Ornithinibacter sp.]